METERIFEEIRSGLAKIEAASAFLYGSRARGDFNAWSDFEVGVVFPDERYLRRADLQELVRVEDVTFYPFKLSEFLAGTPNVPFQKGFFMRELAETAETVFGEDLVKTLKVKLSTLDIAQELRFNIGRAFAGFLSMRSGDLKTANDCACKSCLFGLRAFEVFKFRVFAKSYTEIYDLSQKLGLDSDFVELIDAVHRYREDGEMIEAKLFYRCMSLLDSFEREVLDDLAKNGNKE